MGDTELLEAWRCGDEAAGRELFARHCTMIARFFRNKVDGDIDDLVQRTFLACIEARDRVRTSFRAYALRVAHNELYDHYLVRRRAQQIDPLNSSVIDLGASPSLAASAAQERSVLLEALRHLPMDLQAALELHYWGNLSIAELADALGIPAGTVKTRLFRARRQLRAIMRAMAERRGHDVGEIAPPGSQGRSS